MKVWVTKYALSAGIENVEVETTHNFSYVKEAGPHGRDFHGEGKDWHLTKESAVSRAKEMQADKLASLAKQSDRIKKLRFV